MFTDFPEHIQQQILIYLEADNFRAAKEFRDQYLYQQTLLDENRLLADNFVLPDAE